MPRCPASRRESAALQEFDPLLLPHSSAATQRAITHGRVAVLAGRQLQGTITPEDAHLDDELSDFSFTVEAGLVRFDFDPYDEGMG
eukprot:3459151-Alexandrium_andersonii.AAC.1